MLVICMMMGLFSKSHLLEIMASHLSVPQSILLLKMLMVMQPSNSIADMKIKKLTVSILNTLKSDLHPFNHNYFELEDCNIVLESYPPQSKITIQMDGKDMKV
jgi:hypothetical protein